MTGPSVGQAGALAVALLLAALVLAGCGNEADAGGGGAAPEPFTGVVRELVPDPAGCLAEALTLQESQPACRLVEALAPEAATTCYSTGRNPLDAAGDDALEAEFATRLEVRALCGSDELPCGAFAFCELAPLAGEPAEVRACVADPTLTTPPYCACLNTSEQVVGGAGYCYLDATLGLGSAGLTSCEGPALRFITSPAVPLPAPSSPLLFEVCPGD